MNLQESVLLFPTCFQGVLDGKGMKREDKVRRGRRFLNAFAEKCVLS